MYHLLSLRHVDRAAGAGAIFLSHWRKDAIRGKKLPQGSIGDILE
jgi:hypothetical protein